MIAPPVITRLKPYKFGIPDKGVTTTASWNKTFSWFGFADVYAVTSRSGNTITLFPDKTDTLREFVHPMYVSQEGAFVMCLTIMAIKEGLFDNWQLSDMEFYNRLYHLTMLDRSYRARLSYSKYPPRPSFQVRKIDQVSVTDVHDFVRMLTAM